MLALYRDQYTAAKSAAARMLSSGATSAADLGRFFESHLAPWLVRETGKVKVASGDKERSLMLNLTVTTHFHIYRALARL